MRHVQKVLHDAPCAGGDIVGAAVEFMQFVVGLGLKPGQGYLRCRLAGLQANPDQPILLPRLVHLRPVRRRGSEGWQRRHLHALARGLELPAVVRAFQATLADSSQRQPGTAVRTLVGPGLNGAGRVPP